MPGETEAEEPEWVKACIDPRVVNWLQAKTLEVYRHVDFPVEDSATAPPTVEFAAAQTLRTTFHDFLMQHGIPVKATVDACLKLRWFLESIEMKAGGFQPPFVTYGKPVYSIFSRVNDAVVPSAPQQPDAQEAGQSRARRTARAGIDRRDSIGRIRVTLAGAVSG